MTPERGVARDDGRGRHGGHRDLAGADRGVRADRLHSRHFRPVLPAVRVTIAVSTAISAFNSLTLSPALAALLFKPHHATAAPPQLVPGALRTCARRRLQSRLRPARASAIRGIVRVLVGSWIAIAAMLAVFAGAASARHGLHGAGRCRAASFRRSTRAMRSSSCSCRTAPRCRAPTRSSSRRREIIQKTPGVDYAVAFAGFSGATFTNATNAGVIFASVQAVRRATESTASRRPRSSADLFGSLQSIQEAFIIAMPPPPIRGVGNAGGFKMQMQEREQRRHAPHPGACLRDRRARPTRRRG